MRTDTNPPARQAPQRQKPADTNRDDGRMATTMSSSSNITRLLITAAIVAGFALLTALLTPRGPITTGEALASMLLAGVVGVAIGLLMPSRWVILMAPAVFIGVFELGRLGAVGPTVDAINLGSLYGIVAFVLGRVFHGVLVLVPMTLGAIYGIQWAGRLGQPVARMGRLAWTLTAVASIGLVALAALIARPATTAAIMGEDGAELESGIAELTTVEIGGHDQALMIRGRDTDNPVLLYLNGGPGGTDIGAVRQDVGLEQDFVVVTWEQRGAGKSYAELDPLETFTLDRFISDTIELTDYLRERFNEDRIYLVGQSWGSTLGALAVDARPDLFHAFVGVGQMVSQRETDRLFWEDALAWAQDTGNTAIADSREGDGPPPYEDLNNYAGVISYEHEWNAYPGLDLTHEMPGILFVPEYTFMDRVNAFKGFLDTNATLYPQLQHLDFRNDLTRLDVPYYMVLGEYEARGRAVLADQWFDVLDAPGKERIVFEGSGHRANFDRPGEFAALMRRVLAETWDRP